MNDRKRLVQDALRRALQVRQSGGIDLSESFCVFDLAEQLGVEVRFVDAPSMEATYASLPRPVVLVSTWRPPGRKAYNCAHELGHHVYGHGTRVDELLDQGETGKTRDPDEFVADRFASYLLMPKLTVVYGFVERGWSAEGCTAPQVYTVACWLGVGYSTLVYHMWRSLGLINAEHARGLLRITPKTLRADLIGDLDCGHLLVVDKDWSGKRPADVQVEDLVLAPTGTRLEGDCAEHVRESETGVFLRGRAPGLGRLVSSPGSAVHLRVSRANYTGRSAYRHLEEIENDKEHHRG